MSLYYLILWNQVDILQKHFKKDHVHMRLWTRFYGICSGLQAPFHKALDTFKNIICINNNYRSQFKNYLLSKVIIDAGFYVTPI